MWHSVWHSSSTNHLRALICSLTVSQSPFAISSNCPRTSVHREVELTVSKTTGSTLIFTPSPILSLPIGPLIQVTTSSLPTATQQLIHQPLTIATSILCLISTSNTAIHHSHESAAAKTCHQAGAARSLEAAAFVCAQQSLVGNASAICTWR